MTDCSYCGCEVEAHSPVFVTERRDGDAVDGGTFCNYGCLAQHIEEARLAVGSRCQVDLG